MIEQIKKDREDGFKGALHINHDNNWLESVNGSWVDGHYFSICVSATCDADRRRLIRLPELEEYVLEAHELLKEVLAGACVNYAYIAPRNIERIKKLVGEA